MSAPPSPLPPPPRPLSPNGLSHCALLDLSITAEPLLPPLSITAEPRSPDSAIGQVKQRVKTTNQLPACPEGAELNTTLALRAELQSLQGQQWDAAKALKETLEKNQRTRTMINNRATRGVSFSSHDRLYSSLVSVHVSESHVPRAAIPLVSAPKAPPTAGPDLLTSDPYHRPLPLQTCPTPCVKPRPHSAPFTLSQRRQRWDCSLGL
ncbi:unnamed protein product [Knipowitschia caucasica]|uniref:Protein phosphatase 1 regulatory subunit 35 C-terminal domain-containing protein n=1 Tax=Knipowitschia caucasica TaxID=637954 RepID=A0AAV2KJA8_KNICA